MTREEEIEVLQGLKGDTCFARYFCEEDIDEMCSNIRHGLRIDDGCEFASRARVLELKLKDQAKSESERREMEMRRIVERVWSLNDDGEPYELEDYLGSLVDRLWYIRFKHSKGRGISDADFEWMADLIERYVPF